MTVFDDVVKDQNVQILVFHSFKISDSTPSIMILGNVLPPSVIPVTIQAEGPKTE